jgi:hypothetical protein
MFSPEIYENKTNEIIKKIHNMRTHSTEFHRNYVGDFRSQEKNKNFRKFRLVYLNIISGVRNFLIFRNSELYSTMRG